MRKKLWAVLPLLLMAVSCSGQKEQNYPLSDPTNSGGWVLNEEISDEFNSSILDEDRWFVVGKLEDGKLNYTHPDTGKKVWTGRAPSQFSGNNYRLEDGILKLEVRWEPDFPYFIEEVRVPVFGDPLPYENMTAPCLLGRRLFKYGYIEIRSKSADTQITSGFWSMGGGLEFDFFESFGDGQGKGKEHLDSILWWSIRDWKNLRGKPAYTERKNVGFRFAEDFHVYGIEWSEEGINYYIDGKLFSSVTPEQATAQAKETYDVAEDYNGYVADKDIYFILDMEIFSWNGMPTSREELTQNGTPEQKAGGFMDFEVDYIRLWQKRPTSAE